MEIQQAKIILSNFRPNGQDASDADFSEALALAAQDRHLGEWLAVERAKDAAFSEALNSVTIPDGLRSEILAAINDDVFIESDPEIDEAFINAFADVKPPEGLRDQILFAMEQGEVDKKVVKGKFGMWKFAPYAAAAVVAILGVLVFVPRGPAPSLVDAYRDDPNDASVHAFNIQQTVGMKLVRDDVKLVSNNYTESLKWLEGKNLPITEIPESLKSMRCMGASEISIGEGVEGSLVRFMSAEGKEVNMLVIANENVSPLSNLPVTKTESVDDAYFCANCDYWISRMQSKDATVILLSETEKDSALGIF